MPVAYSYIRFSSKAQELGDSQRRQIKLAQDYASANGLDLDTTYRDLGVSGYRGANRHIGALGVFLRDVDDGVIPPNSWLLVEALDRLTRESLDQALPLLLSIINRGITIVSLLDNHVYSQDTIKRDNGIGLIISITQFVRGNDESKKKSDRLNESWINRREQAEQGAIMTSRCPYWLIVDDERKFKVIEENAAIVRRIYDMASTGLGGVVISRTLNEEGVQSARGGVWTSQTIRQLLRNPATIGHAQTRVIKDPIKNYYPPIISDEQWHLINNQIDVKRDKNIAGRKNKQLSILLSGKMVCASCGAKMRAGDGHKSIQYVRCRNAMESRLKCIAPGMSYNILESYIIGLIIGGKIQIVTYNEYKDDTDDKIKELEKIIARLTDELELIDDPAPIRLRINTRTKEIKDLKASRPKHPITAASVSFDRVYKLCVDFLNITSGRVTGDVNPIRDKIKIEFTRLIDKIVVGGEVPKENTFVRELNISGELCVLLGRPEGIKIEADVGVHFRRQQRQQGAQPTPKTLEEKLLEGAKEVENLPNYRRASPIWLERVSKQKKVIHQ